MNEPTIILGGGEISGGSGAGMYDPHLGLRVVLGCFEVIRDGIKRPEPVTTFDWSPYRQVDTGQGLFRIQIIGDGVEWHEEFREMVLEYRKGPGADLARPLRAYIDNKVLRHMTVEAMVRALANVEAAAYEKGIRNTKAEMRRFLEIQ